MRKKLLHLTIHKADTGIGDLLVNLYYKIMNTLINPIKQVFVFAFTLFVCLSACKESFKKETAKETYLPQEVWNVAEKNDYTDPNAQFSFDRMIETDNLVVFWEPDFGDDPTSTVDPKFRVPLTDLMQECEKIYAFYRDDLKFVQQGNSLTDRYRMNIYLYHNEDGTVYGGGSEKKIGAMWLSPNRVQQKPYGALAHELGHAFQYMVSGDGNWGFSTNPEGGRGQTIFEMTSQYMLWQYYPEWIVFENYHLVSYMNNTHKAFMHEDNCYSSPHVFEYWAHRHGIDFIGKLWREAKEGEDAVIAYKRMTGIDQKTFNDEMLDAYLKFVTWDLDRIREVSKPYANQHTSAFTSIGNGWYQIAEERCPQNYGYNGIQLNVPSSEAEITLNFKGITNAKGYRSVNKDKAGWRYGFVAMTQDEKRVYSDKHSEAEGTVKFIVPEHTSHLWLVVSGAPTEHWEHLWDGDANNDEQWPYQIKLTGTSLHHSILK